MGFLMDVLSEGLYGACVNAEYSHNYKQFCKSIGQKPINPYTFDVDAMENVDEDESEDDENVVTRVKVRTVVDRKTLKETKAESEEIKLLPGPKNIETVLFNKQDIIDNIDALIERFKVDRSIEEDVLILSTLTTAMLFSIGLADSDTIFDALKEDSAQYAIANQMVRIFMGKPMDKKVSTVDITSKMPTDGYDEMKAIIEWESEYLLSKIDSATDFHHIKSAQKNILKCLDKLKNMAPDIIDVEPSDFREIDDKDETEELVNEKEKEQSE